ncbi:MAG: DUF1963 domain-containing protein [Candidatus Obscuribacterales bacterium]|nr:DUF1963 domain-containing protein [Candidatus Obscuribacterales bacterium]
MHESILERIEADSRELAEKLLANDLLPCFYGRKSEWRADDWSRSRIGGAAYLPEGLEHPKDKSGRAMLFLAQVNFSELAAVQDAKQIQGLLLLFWNAARDHSNPKDRNAFRCIYLKEPRELSAEQADLHAPQLSTQFRLEFSPGYSIDKGGEIPLRNQIGTLLQADACSQILGEPSSDIQRLREIAAFAANGVSWSLARREDSCFSHLLDAAENWQFLWRIDSVPEIGLDLDDRSLYLLIKREDLEAGLLDRAWLLLQ